MPVKSDKAANGAVVRRSAAVAPKRSASDAKRLDAAMRKPVDTSDIAERTGRRRRVYRDASGRLPRKAASPLRDAILAELGRRQMTRQELWKAARKTRPDLPEDVVYEFLRGQRQIGVNHLEALLTALNLTIAPAA